MKKIVMLMAVFSFIAAFAASACAAPFDQVLQRWTKSRKFTDPDGGTLEVRATYYSGEFVDALVLKEATDNMWTQQETDDYKAKLLGTLRLNEMIPVRVEFVNNGPTMYLGPFDIMAKLRIGNKVYKAADYDKRFNFKFQGRKDGLLFFARNDEKTNKDLLKGQKQVRLEIAGSISPITNGQDTTFVWDIANDDPQRLYSGTAAKKLETERLLKRLGKLKGDLAEEDKKVSAIKEEMSTIQQRLDELAK